MRQNAKSNIRILLRNEMNQKLRFRSLMPECTFLRHFKSGINHISPPAPAGHFGNLLSSIISSLSRGPNESGQLHIFGE